MRPSSILVALVLCSGASAFTPAVVSFPVGRAAAQTARGIDTSAALALREGDDLHLRLRPREALEVFEKLVEERPDHFGGHWRAAREAVSLGMLTSDPDDRKGWFRTAEEHARRAVEVAPEEVEGHFWLAAALGRRALDEGVAEKARLAGEVRAEALLVLERDSTHAGAHHVLGHWHAEAMRLRGITRFLAQKLLGADVLGEASWDAARHHLERAVALDPGGLVHHLELARLHLDRDRPEDARSELREVLERPALEPADAVHKQHAQDLLRRLP